MANRTRRAGWFVAVGLLLAACTSPTQSSTPPRASPNLTPAAADLCAGSTYSRCVASVTSAIEAGAKLFAVCEYAGGEGDVVLLENASDAEASCSENGQISPRKVFQVVDIHP